MTGTSAANNELTELYWLRASKGSKTYENAAFDFIHSVARLNSILDRKRGLSLDPAFLKSGEGLKIFSHCPSRNDFR